MNGNQENLPAKKEPINMGIAEISGPRGLVISSYDELMQAAKLYHASGMSPSSLDTVPKVAIGIAHLMELGIPIIAGLQHIAVINGRAGLWGRGVLARIEGSGQLEKREEKESGTPFQDDWTFTCTVRRKGYDEEHVGVFTWEDAKRAGLADPKRRDGSEDKFSPWRRFPKRMMKWKARYILAEVFADLLTGLSMAEDLVGTGSPEDAVIVESQKKEIVPVDTPPGELYKTNGANTEATGEPELHPWARPNWANRRYSENPKHGILGFVNENKDSWESAEEKDQRDFFVQKWVPKYGEEPFPLPLPWEQEAEQPDAGETDKGEEGSDDKIELPSELAFFIEELGMEACDRAAIDITGKNIDKLNAEEVQTVVWDLTKLIDERNDKDQGDGPEDPEPPMQF